VAPSVVKLRSVDLRSPKGRPGVPPRGATMTLLSQDGHGFRAGATLGNSPAESISHLARVTRRGSHHLSAI
jgi:hypothetical protein